MPSLMRKNVGSQCFHRRNEYSFCRNQCNRDTLAIISGSEKTAPVNSELAGLESLSFLSKNTREHKNLNLFDSTSTKSALVMVSFQDAVDEKIAANLLWKVKAIATKEFESLPSGSQKTLFLNETRSPRGPFVTEFTKESREDRRSRAVSVDSMEMAVSCIPSSPLLGRTTITIVNQDVGLGALPNIDHNDWSKRVSLLEDTDSDDQFPMSPTSPQLALVTQKFGKRKRESFVGQQCANGVVRAILRKKFSWKQYPELEEFLITNQDEYFEFSSKNYTAEQRKYNNGLTHGLLELASKEGYVFEEFTFSMIRDRIRCYFKSHSQSAKKKRRR